MRSRQIVDDHHLAVHHDGGDGIRIPRRGVEKTNPVHDAGRDKLLDEAAAAALRGLGLEPGRMHFRRDDQHTKRGHVQHLLRQQARNIGGAGELVLDVDETVCRIDRCLEQPCDLVHAGIARGFDLRPRDARNDVPGLNRHRGRPAVAADCGSIFDRAAGSPPSAFGQFRKRRGGFAIDHALDIVERRIGSAVGIGPVRMMGGVIAGVPAPDRQIEFHRKMRPPRR